MKDLKIGASKKKLPTKLIALTLSVISVIGLGYFSYKVVWNNSFTESTVRAEASTSNKNTAYTGNGVNTEDPAAAEAYCEDTKERINITGSSRIIDTCVAKSVSNEWLSKMTSEEIESMYNLQPTCIETGFDDQGYSCFTGYNSDGCNKEGQKEDGSYCDGQAPVSPVDFLSGYNSSEVCGLLADCKSESEFSPEGLNKFGCDRQGRTKSGAMCPYEHITRLYDGGYDQLGFSKEGFNKNNCDIRGYTPEGVKCAFEDVTVVYGLDKKNQFGFFEDGYNDKNCNIEGLNRESEACSLSDITRVFNAETGRDQLGFDPDGYNDKNCHFSGFNRQGELCAESDITKIYGKSGKDQRGIFASGLNEYGCLSTGLKRNSELCTIDEIPNVFNPVTGMNALGYFASGYNENGCSASGYNASGEICDLDDITRVYSKKTKLDQFDLSESGYNIFGCGVDGYRQNGEFCDYDEIPSIIDPKTGLNQFGLDSDGYSKATGCSVAGFDRDNNRCEIKDIPRLFKTGEKYDQFGIGADGFNDKGCSIKGLDKNNKLCDLSDTPRIFDPLTNTDQFGLLPDGFTLGGCNLEGKRRDGTNCDLKDTPRIFGLDGVDHRGMTLNGEIVSSKKIDKPQAISNKLDTSNFGVDALKRLGFIDGVYNENDCDINGRNKVGELCDFSDVTRVFDKVTGRDQFGLDPQGYNVFGCGIDGKKSDGTLCKAEHVTRIYDINNKDQFGVDATESPVVKSIYKANHLSAALSKAAKDALKLDSEGFSIKTGCNLVGVNRRGEICAFDEIPKVYDPETGRDQLGFSPEGYNIFNCDFDGKKPDGSLCSPEEITELMSSLGKNQFGQHITGLPRNNSVYDNGGNGGYLSDKLKKMIESKYGDKSPKLSGEELIAKTADSLGFQVGFLKEKIAELGLDGNMRNAKGCGLDGMNANKELCAFEDIPRIFDPETGLDQFGISKENRNIWGCDIYGFDRENKRCPDDKITRIVGGDGFDHRGLDENNLTASGLTVDGRNSFGCDVDGMKSDNTECESWEKIDTFGVDGFNNKNIDRAGKDRFKLIDGRNSFGCDVNGLKEDKSLCSIDEITRFFKKDGTDQFGLRRNNRNKFGCDLEGKSEDGTLCKLENIPRIFNGSGVDQLGLTSDGFTAQGCSIAGLKRDGSICSLSDIPRLIGDNGFDQFNIGADGFNDKNCNLLGLNRQGEICPIEDIPMIFGANGLSQLGITRDGFSENGCSITGVNRQGLRCDVKDIPRLRNIKGEDQFGIFPDGFNSADCDLNGNGRNSEICAQSDISRIIVDGVDQLNFGEKGYNPDTGCNLNNKDQFGNSCHPKFAVKIVGVNGQDQFGMVDGFNQYGCDLEARNADGELCDVADITTVVDPTTGRDQFGIVHETSLSPNGCGLDGMKADGTLCKPEDIPRITDINGIDQFGLTHDGYSEKTSCNLLGLDREGNLCEPEDVPFILGSDGFSHLGVDANRQSIDGYSLLGFDAQGCDRDNKKIGGAHCDKYVDLNIDVADTERLGELRKLQKAAFASYDGVLTPEIGVGTVNIAEINYESSVVAQQGGYASPSTVLTPVSQEGSDVKGNGIIEIPEGTTMQIYVETPVNSDYTTTVWGEIIGGELDGSRVRGSIEVPYINDVVMPRDKFKYNFNTIIRDRKSYTINAVSMTFEDLGEFVEADNVEYHTMQRYGGLLTAAAFQALGASYLDSAEERALSQQSAITQQATASLLNQNTQANAKENLSIATDQIADIAKQNFFRRPTIEKSATNLMIIFMEPVDNDELPVVYSNVR